ncbi:hypothetical protein HR060_11685 [Catenovulum sp. SM1970]|uniref:hypothetical protein n=1 Tax=Marinifaba aquimaris TaxID=2741323 RepID=UPI001571962A|nr:hypothetical protein [Marinifaba aquimaris]NTS77524.1 hypothetical protein [Marinifaba aquimaris]
MQTSDADGTTPLSTSTSPLTLAANGGPLGTGDSYLQYTDVDTNFMHAVFGTGWSGDLSAFNNGTFSFDYIQTAPTSGSSFISDFGFFRIFGGGQTAGIDVIPSNPSVNWTTQSFNFSAANFGVSNTVWNTILSDVTGIWLNVESWNGVTEVVGIDNISLTAATVSEPPTLSLLIFLLACWMFVRRRFL